MLGVAPADDVLSERSQVPGDDELAAGQHVAYHARQFVTEEIDERRRIPGFALC